MKTTNKVSGFSAFAWIWAIMLVIAPLLYVLIISFMQRDTLGNVDYTFNLFNYTKMLESDFTKTLLASVARSVALAFLTTVACILVGFPLALFLVFRAGKWRNFLFFMLIVPFWTNFLIRTYAWMVLLSDNGWINHFLELIGFPAQSFNWLFTPKAVFIGMFYNYLPYMAMALFVSVEKIDVKLLEAAADLGAGQLKRFFQITLPLCVPGLVTGSIMVFIPAMGEFVIPDILGGGTNLFIGNLLAQQFLTVRNWPLGSAISVVLILLIGACLAIFEKMQKNDETLLV